MTVTWLAWHQTTDTKMAMPISPPTEWFQQNGSNKASYITLTST